MTEVKTVKSGAFSNTTRGQQLWSIMTDAAQNVLDRPENPRGPYLINDKDLKLEKRVSAR